MASDIVSATDDTLDNALDGIISVGLGVYLIMVFSKGNVMQLFTELKKEYGFLEYLVALYIIYRLMKISSIAPIVGSLVLGAGIVALLKSAGDINTGLFDQFASGNIGLFSLVYQLFGGSQNGT